MQLYQVIISDECNATCPLKRTESLLEVIKYNRLPVYMQIHYYSIITTNGTFNERLKGYATPNK